MKQEFYIQCTFEAGNVRTTAWIPEDGVEVGKLVQFKEDADSDKWWGVVSVGTNRITAQQAKGLERRNLKFQNSLRQG